MEHTSLTTCDFDDIKLKMASDQVSAKLLLQGLPSRTQINLDAHPEIYLTNEQFTGIKSLPPGWHCISWSIASSESSTNDASQATPSATSFRNVLLKWFDQDEIAVRGLDRLEERLVVPDQFASPSHAASGSGIGRSKHRRDTRTIDPSSSPAEAILITPDVLSSVEPHLLPYPAEAGQFWRKATLHLSRNQGRVGRQVVARVLGVNVSTGDSTTDSLAAGPSAGKDTRKEETLPHPGITSGRKEDGKLIWGKSRPPTETFEVALDGEDACAGNDLSKSTSRKRSLSTESTEDVDDDDEALLFTNFDLKRSWPAHSIGAEITHWSEDKSWLLQDVARRSHLGIAHPVGGETSWYLALLCEFELAFVLFIAANNAHAFDCWKDLIVLFCRSSSLIGAQSAFQLHPSAATFASDSQHSTAIDLTAHTAFLTTLRTHLLILPADFWSSQSTTQQENHLLKQLDVLRANIARSLSTPSQRQHKVEEAHREQLVKAWRVLSHTTASRFGWTLDSRLDEEAEVQDDIEAEEGEDAPVIVDL